MFGLFLFCFYAIGFAQQIPNFQTFYLTNSCKLDIMYYENTMNMKEKMKFVAKVTNLQTGNQEILLKSDFKIILNNTDLLISNSNIYKIKLNNENCKADLVQILPKSSRKLEETNINSIFYKTDLLKVCEKYNDCYNCSAESECYWFITNCRPLPSYMRYFHNIFRIFLLNK